MIAKRVENLYVHCVHCREMAEFVLEEINTVTSEVIYLCEACMWKLGETVMEMVHR